jgi:carbamate kinase
MTKRALIAIGGNAIIADSRHPDIPHQWDAIRQTCKHLVDMIEDGWQIIVTHGNGPQAGFILRRSELAAHEVFPLPLDIIVADTQGGIGYMLQQALHNELYSRDLQRSVVALITQTLVDAQDPAFQNPSKPIGAFLSEAQARVFEGQGWQVMEDAFAPTTGDSGSAGYHDTARRQPCRDRGGRGRHSGGAKLQRGIARGQRGLRRR